jgi:hypothetical protein
MTLAFGGLYAPVCVVECTYAGYEHLTEFSLDSADGCIQAGSVEKARFSDIGPNFKQKVTNATELIIEQGIGEQLARSFINARYASSIPDDEDLAGLTSVLSKVLSQVGEAYVSLHRQWLYEHAAAITRGPSRCSRKIEAS